MSEVTRTKICPTCGRSFAWRAKWRRTWETVRYCSARCRAERPGAFDRRIEALIRATLAQRGTDATICPSEIARAIRPAAWRPLMPRVQNAARRLARSGAIRITQRGREIDPATAKGPIRLARPRAPAKGSWHKPPNID